MVNYYETLGVEKTATQDEIKSAYRRAAKEWHPDVNPNRREEAEKKFKDIGEAYATLSDPEKRSAYDNPGRGSFDPFFDIFRNWEMNQTQGPRNVTAGIEIDLIEAAEGAVRKVSIEHEVACDDCAGTGSTTKERTICNRCSGAGRIQTERMAGQFRMMQSTTCPECRGKGSAPEKPCGKCAGRGEISKQDVIEINIPAGVDNRHVLRVPKMGRNGGDLNIFVAVRHHPKFERLGNDLHCNIDIPFLLALRGGLTHTTGLSGEQIEIIIPRACRYGYIAFVPAKGIKGGDLKVTIHFKLPQLDDQTLEKVVNILPQ